MLQSPLIHGYCTLSDLTHVEQKLSVSECDCVCVCRVQAISLGQGQGPVAEKLIANATQTGDWVFLQVSFISLLLLLNSWMPTNSLTDIVVSIIAKRWLFGLVVTRWSRST